MTNTKTKASKQIYEVLNSCYNDLIWEDKANNKEKPHVCTVCDVFMKPCEVDALELEEFCKLKDILRTPITKDIQEEVKKCYRFHVASPYRRMVDNVLLSPRGRFYNPTHQPGTKKTRKTRGACMSICKQCKRDLMKKEVPKFAISNGFFFGTPPSCLKELTEIELAWITPIKTFGIVYVYTGGPLQQLKGSASFYKRRNTSIASATAKLEVLGLTEDGVMVVLLGSMTPAQAKKAKQKTTIRPKKILAAVEWLMKNNDDWKSIDYDRIKLALKKTHPIIVRDETQPVGGVEANIENTETFRVYFPDGTLHSDLGGQQTSSDFLSAAIKEKTDSNDPGKGGLFVEARFDSERVQDYKDKNLVNACLLQFPFGRGGLMSESHFHGGEKGPKRISHEEYIEHLSRISQPHFHGQLFTLILFNYLMKDWMVKKAAVACKNEGTAKTLAENLTSAEFLQALDQRRKKKKITSPSAQKMLATLEAVAACAPHTNQAAKKARYKVETMQCHFGLPSWFLTVTPDDENSLLLQVYSGEDISLKLTSWDQVESMSEKELSDLGIKKRTLRYKFPGIAAFNFENQRDAIIKHVIGWDMEKKCATGVPGIFGECKAFVLAVEEQGRKSLHMHILIWISRTQEALASIFNNKRKRQAMEFLCHEIDRVSSCELIGSLSCVKKRRKIFHHDKCEMFSHSIRYPRIPQLISTQRLRDLRNSEGRKNNPDHMKCHYCEKTFSAHEIIPNYLKDLGMEKLSSFPENKSKRIKTMAMALINGGGTDTRTKPIFNATYNHHIHTKSSCFCKGNTKCSSPDCRYKYPKLPRDKTILIDTGFNTNWYSLDGSYSPRSVFETAPKRNVTDVFMNQYCSGIGISKLINGNTNVNLLTPGPYARYTTKYAAKDNQKDDSEEYNQTTNRVLMGANRIDVENLQRKQKEFYGAITESDRKAINESTALTRVLRLGFCRHEPNVIGAPLASYLIRNKTRFLFSHDFKFAPVYNIETVLNKGTIKMYLQRSGSGSYCGNTAYDYICRPNECKDYSLFEFMRRFETVQRKPTKKNMLMNFIQTEGFIHPSWKEGKNQTDMGSYRAGIRAKDMTDERNRTFIQIPSYFLPDTAMFNGNIKDIISKETEEYSRKALLLFKPYRTLNDLRTPLTPKSRASIELIQDQLLPYEKNDSLAFLDDLKAKGSFTETFRLWLEEDKKSQTKKLARQFLQNFQDCSYNCTRKSRIGDELDRITQKFKKNQDANIDNNSDEEDNQDPAGEDYFFDEQELAEMVQMLCPEHFLEENTNESIPSHYLTKDIRDKGTYKCGYEYISLMDPLQTHEDGVSSSTERPAWLQINGNNASVPEETHDDNQDETASFENPTKKEVLEVILVQKERVVRKDRMFEENAEVEEANGSAESIISWSKKAKLDANQRAAFEMIVASFVLTFFEDPTEEEDDTEEGITVDDEQLYSSQKAKLEKLADIPKRGTQQLIALLYGAGGAGKSYVIDLVMLYAREYCNNFANFVFDKRTIAVTAVTGSAATLLNGETAHSALCLCTNIKNIDQEDIEAWKRCRLLIIDEISFACEKTMHQINKKLRYYRETEETDPTLFGGINIVIAGDFRQLDPVGSPPLYETTYGLGLKVNCFLELTGMHRFKNDPEWGNLLKKFRDGTVTVADIHKLNRHITENSKYLPPNLKYATYRNADRDSINTALFDEALKNKSDKEAEKFGLLVFADNIHLKTGKRSYNKRLGTCRLLYSKAEDDIEIQGLTTKRMDPVLKLYEGIRVLLTHNEDVLNGIANGTQAEVVQIVLKNGEAYGTTTVVEGNGNSKKVKAVFASQIEYVELRHTNDRVAVPIFRMKPEEFFFRTELPTPAGEREIEMKALQLPIIVNNATTGHKLQGCSVDSIFVHQWSKKRNWNYVILSRVRQMKGLYARKKIPCDLSIYKVPERLKQMLEILKTKAPSNEATRHP